MSSAKMYSRCSFSSSSSLQIKKFIFYAALICNLLSIILLRNNSVSAAAVVATSGDVATGATSNKNGTILTEVIVTSGPLINAASGPSIQDDNHSVAVTESSQTPTKNVATSEPAVSTTTTTTTTSSLTTVTPSTLIATTSTFDNRIRISEDELWIVGENSTDPSTTSSTTPVTPRFVYEPTYKCKNDSEVLSNCTNSCPASCEDPTRTACREFCWKGCECAPGYVKDHKWQCIALDECPKCGTNEHYRNCGTSCEPSCENYRNIPVHCSNRVNCKRGCFCDYGFVRDANGSCVPIAECPQKCGPNEYWDVSGEPCVRSVENPRPSCLFEIPIPACVCNTGFRRNVSSKKCEPISSLAADLIEQKCGLNETFSFCDSECARYCFDEAKRQSCPTICQRGCFCKPEYLRESSGRCVLPDDCHQGSGGHQPGTLVFSV